MFRNGSWDMGMGNLKPKSPASVFHLLSGFLFMAKNRFYYRPKKVVFNDVTDQVRETAAEIIDMGSIKFVRRGHAYRVTVTVRTSNLGEAHFLRSHFGGYYYRQEKGGVEWHWVSYQQGRAEKVLREVHPWMVVLARQAEIVFLVKDHIRGKVRQHKLTDEEKVYREGLLDEIRLLNKALYHSPDKDGVVAGE